MASLRSELESRLPSDWRHPLATRPPGATWAPSSSSRGRGDRRGVLTWHYVVPDMRRYLKIHCM